MTDRDGAPTIRHYTATGFVAHDGATLLHWHERVEAWLPPGGHVEPNEDPVQAVLREVLEETGLEVEIVPSATLPNIGDAPQIVPPRTILIEDVYDEKVGAHQHIDLIYFTVALQKTGHPETPEAWRWFTREMLENLTPVQTPAGTMEAPPEDVVNLGIMAIDAG